MAKLLIIDARWLHTGIGRYVMNLLEGLKHPRDFSVHALVRKGDADWVRQFCDGVTVADMPIYDWREQLAVPWAAREADILHVPHYNAPVVFKRGLVVTVHDLIHLMGPPISNSFKSRMYAWPIMRLAIQKARTIVTVSQFSKNQLVQRLGVPEGKVTVIYNGVHPRFRRIDHNQAQKRVEVAHSISSPFLLYVGNLKLHKNLELLLRAFSLQRMRGACNHSLVIVGDGSKEKQLLAALCTSLGISENVRFISRVDDEALPDLYAAADVFVMPSLMEGFGYPVVEAMACGTPVACSRASVLPEIAGDAAQFFDPTSCEDLAGAIEELLRSSQRREMLRQRGLERARVFSWEECGRGHAELYRQLMSA